MLRDKADRRVTPDRRAKPRGGRRAGDAPSETSLEPCDTCGSKEIEFVAWKRGYEEYHCLRCGTQLFRLSTSREDNGES